MKITTIYCDNRKDTTGFYVDRALKALGCDFSHVNPVSQPITPGSDYYLLVDDGIDYQIQGDKSKLIYWAIDTHFTPEQCKKKAGTAKWVFRAQKNGESVLPGSIWLPLGCDEEIHSAETKEKIYDVCFVGNTHNSMVNRINCLDALFKEFPNFYFGQKFFKDASEKYGKSKIVFNRSLDNDINMRVFEAMCSGSLLLTDEIKDNGFEDLGFKDGINCATYADEKEMINKAKYYLAKYYEREAIAKAGAVHVKALHQYKNRVEKILETIGGVK